MMATNTCPYCRSPVAPGESAKECPSCGTPHHADCWVENGGCAVVGCSSGPVATNPTAVELPPIEEPTPTVVVDVEEERKRSRVGLAVGAGVAILAMVAAGVGIAVVLRDASKGEGIEVEAAKAPSSAQPARARQSSAATPSLPSEFSDAEVVAGAEQVLLHHHQLLAKAEGDPNSPYARRAFALLSARKQRKEAEDAGEGEGGFEYWVSKREYENLSIGSEVCLPGRVELRAPGYWNPGNGEAMVYVDYGSYAGFTWVLYEHGHWTYDAGYGHVPSREARWAPEEEILFRSTGHGC